MAIDSPTTTRRSLLSGLAAAPVAAVVTGAASATDPAFAMLDREAALWGRYSAAIDAEETADERFDREQTPASRRAWLAACEATTTASRAATAALLEACGAATTLEGLVAAFARFMEREGEMIPDPLDEGLRALLDRARAIAASARTGAA